MNFPSARWSESMSDYNKAQLVGRRLVVSKEVDQAQQLNAEFIKSLTGDEALSARHPYGRPFNFTPVAKFIMAVNHKPAIRDESHGMWRRVRLVPFTRTFPLNPGFAERLAAEAPGALTWAVEGAVRYYAEGLKTPNSVRAATEEEIAASLTRSPRSSRSAACWALTSRRGRRRCSMSSEAVRLESHAAIRTDFAEAVRATHQVGRPLRCQGGSRKGPGLRVLLGNRAPESPRWS